MTKQNVIALICNSNMFVPYVLTEILAHKEQQYLVMSDTDNIATFFMELELQNVDFLKYKQPTKYSIFSCRKKLLDSVKNYTILKIIFFHAEFGGIINWFILKESSRIPICYCSVFDSLPYKKVSSNKLLLSKIKQYLINGVFMDMLDNGTRIIPSLPPRFFAQTKTSYIKMSVDHNLIKNYISEKISINANVKILLLIGSVVDGNFVEKEEYIKKENSLIESLGIENVVAKCHPRFSDIFGKELELPLIPSYIPANLLIDSFDVFIGNHTTLLVEAAIKGKKAISLLDFFIQKSSIQASNSHTFFDNRLKGKGIIYFPKSIQEINDIINCK